MERNGEVISSNAEDRKKVEVYEILSRLPARSLMRFKCVCKYWQSIIQKDEFFKDLHFSRSKAARTCSLLHVSEHNENHRLRLLSAEVSVPTKEDERAHLRNASVWKPRFRQQRLVCILDGLVCFMNTENHRTRIYNISTGESTPWIKSSIEEQVRHPNPLMHVFGYDQATKKYKVLALWESSSDRGLFCEVLTVRQNSWRQIDGIPSAISMHGSATTSVHVNGSIYFLCKSIYRFGYRGIPQTIVEFNVGSEKFRVVETTSYFSFRDVLHKAQMMDLDGRLCLLTYDAQDKTRRTIHMSVLHNHGEDVQDEKSKMTSDAGSNGDFYWVEAGTLSLPLYTDLWSIRHIPGTNLFIIESLNNNYPYTYDHYIWNNKSRKADIVISLTDETEKYDDVGFYTFTPNLSPVN